MSKNKSKIELLNEKIKTANAKRQNINTKPQDLLKEKIEYERKCQEILMDVKEWIQKAYDKIDKPTFIRLEPTLEVISSTRIIFKVTTVKNTSVFSVRCDGNNKQMVIETLILSVGQEEKEFSETEINEQLIEDEIAIFIEEYLYSLFDRKTPFCLDSFLKNSVLEKEIKSTLILFENEKEEYSGEYSGVINKDYAVTLTAIYEMEENKISTPPELEFNMESTAHLLTETAEE